MIKYLTKNFGLTALGLCILLAAVEMRGAIHDYKDAEVHKYELTLQSIEKFGEKAGGAVMLANALPAQVLNHPLPVKVRTK
jgi:hypothetical protein